MPFTMPSTPRENAMSVAMGTPQPCNPGLAIVQRHKEQRGNDHATQGPNDGQRSLAHVAQLAVDDFVLDLHPHQEEENRHQSVVDPVVYGELDPGEGEFEFPDVVVGVMPRGIRPYQSDDRGSQQHDAADALDVNEFLNRQHQRTGHQRLAESHLHGAVGAGRNCHCSFG